MAASAARFPTCAAKSFVASASTRWPVAAGSKRGGQAGTLALVRPLDHRAPAAPRDPHRHGREREALDLEVSHHRERPFALGAEAVRHRDAHALEDELGGEGCAHAELVLPLLAEAEAGH